jgi:hypothetical protein
MCPCVFYIKYNINDFLKSQEKLMLQFSCDFVWPQVHNPWGLECPCLGDRCKAFILPTTPELLQLTVEETTGLKLSKEPLR